MSAAKKEVRANRACQQDFEAQYGQRKSEIEKGLGRPLSSYSAFLLHRAMFDVRRQKDGKPPLDRTTTD